MRKSFCDRCGNEIKGKCYLIESVVSFLGSFNAVKLVYKMFPDTDLELCEECSKSLEKWFKEGKS